MRSKQFDEGMKVRREVLGDAYVDRAIAQAGEDTMFIQEFITEAAWGGVWARPGLDRRSRSLLNIGMLTAMNRLHELEIHVRGALTNGLTRHEILEALLHAAVYCGVPATLDGLRVARKVFAAVDAGGEADAAGAGGGPGERPDR
ncbi:MAG: carboxymuconolactone decarboxylase family protein [Lautropia sp.]